MRVFSNLNLNGSTPPRVQPRIGEWGPAKVPTTRAKKRMRIWVSMALFGAMLAIFLLGWYVLLPDDRLLGLRHRGHKQFLQWLARA